MEALPEKIFTEEEYLSLEKDSPSKNEFFHGEIFAMGGASLNQNTLIANLIFLLMNHLGDKPC
jgi:Uma2 family endonuclease